MWHQTILGKYRRRHGKVNKILNFIFPFFFVKYPSKLLGNQSIRKQKRNKDYLV